MAWWVLLAIVVATTVLAGLLAPKGPGSKPSALGDFNAPTAEEGRIIPVIAGTVKMSGPNVVWYGDFHAYPIKTRSGLFSVTTTGYRYYLGMDLALCHGPIEAVGETLVGTATAVVTVTGTSPFAPNWWAKWTAFILPTLPEDAVIQKIYAVCRASHSVDVPANGAALATVKYGTENNGVSVVPGAFTDNPIGLGFNQGVAIVSEFSEYDDLFYIDTENDTLEWIETMAMGASMGHSLFQFGIHDVLLVTGLGFAVYYTSATATDDSTDLPAPVEIPAGQGVAWSYPDTVETSSYPPPENRGTVEATAGVSIEFGTFGLTAGQAPDDIAVPHSVLAVTADKITLRMTAPGLFGGDDRLPTSEGGLEGEVRVYRGTQTQGADAYLSTQLGLSYPEYKGLCHAVFGACYFGKSNYLKNMNFILRRFPSNLGLPRSVTYIDGDANPAEVIYETMTNQLWGLARPAARFDLANWQAAAISLASEGMGISVLWDRDAEAQELIDDILRHIDAVVQTDPESGLWTIKLIRPQAPELELTEADLLEAPEFSRGSWEETWNDLVLTFTDGATFKPRTVTAQDSANQRVVGAVTTQNLDFLLFTKPAIAQQIAMRELKTHSYPLKKFRLKAKRKAWPLRVGSSFTIAWPPTGIVSLALRVLNIDYGQLEKGTIEIDAVEDAFAVAYSAFDTPQDSAWTDPVTDVEPPDAQLLQEAPYEWLESATAEEWILAGATRGDGSAQGFEIWADEGSGYFHGNDGDAFMPSGFLMADYSRTTAALDATGFTLETGRDLNVIQGTDAAGRAHGDCLVLFADTQEICAFETATDNGDETSTLANIVRGVYDTLPADHPAGTRVFIIRDGGGWLLFPYRVDGGRVISPILSLRYAGRIPTGQAFGVPVISVTQYHLTAAGGISSEQGLGIPSLSLGWNLKDAGGIASDEIFGIPSLWVEGNLTIAGGIPSTESFGVAHIWPEGNLIAAGGIPSGEVFGIPNILREGNLTVAGGIPTAQAFGIPNILREGNLTLAGGIPSAEGFGVAHVWPEGNLIAAGGIPTSEGFGVPSILREGNLIAAGGISSREAFGIAKLSPPCPFPDSYTIEPKVCLSQPAGQFKIKMESIVVHSALGDRAYGAREWTVDDPGVPIAIAATKNIAQWKQHLGQDIDTFPQLTVYVTFEFQSAHGLSTYDKVYSHLAAGDETNNMGSYIGEILVLDSTRFRIGWDPDNSRIVKPWHANTWYEAGTRAFNGTVLLKATTSGYSGGILPAFAYDPGELVYDGTVIWKTLYRGTTIGHNDLSSSSRIYRGIFRRSTIFGEMTTIVGSNLGVLPDFAQITVSDVANSSFNGTFHIFGTTYRIDPDVSGELINYLQAGADAVSGGGYVGAGISKREQVYYVTIQDLCYTGDATGTKLARALKDPSFVGVKKFLYVGSIYVTHDGGDVLVTPGGWPSSQIFVVN